MEIQMKVKMAFLDLIKREEMEREVVKKMIKLKRVPKIVE
jgi:hypothetical protein